MKKVIVGVLIGGLINVSTVSAGGGGSKILLGAVVGIATGGLSFAAGAPLAGAIASGATAAIGTASGASTSVGASIGGNGNFQSVDVGVSAPNGTSVADLHVQPQHADLPVVAKPPAQEARTEPESATMADVSVSEDVRPTSEEASVVDSAATLTLSTLTRPIEEEIASSETRNLMLSAMISADRAAEEQANTLQVSEDNATPSEARSGVKRQGDESVLPASKVSRLEESIPAVDTLLRFQESETSSEPVHIGTMIQECIQVGSDKVSDFADTAVTFTKDVAEEMVTPGGVANKRAYEAGEISAQEYNLAVATDLAADATAGALFSQIGGSAGGVTLAVAGAVSGGAAGGPAGAVAGGTAGASTGAKVGAAAGAVAGVVCSRATKAIVRATDSCFKGTGESSSSSLFAKTSGENWHKLSKAEKKVKQKEFVDKQVKVEKNWTDSGHKIGGRKAFQNQSDSSIYYTLDTRHGDIEVWRVTGKKAEHQGSMEALEGKMYRGANHNMEVFE